MTSKSHHNDNRGSTRRHRFLLNLCCLFSLVTVGSGLASAAPPIGQVISLKAVATNLFVSADQNLGSTAPLVGDRTGASTWEEFKVVDAGGGRIALLSVGTGKYVSADQNLGVNAPLVADRAVFNTWEEFQWIDLGNNQIHLLSVGNGKFVSADLNIASTAPLNANRTAASTWETFVWASVGGGGNGGGGGGNGGGNGGGGFAPYDDISLGVGQQVVSMASQARLKTITLAFMEDGGCTPVWGGLGGGVNANFPNGTSVTGAINQLKSNGVSVIISFGGANGSVQGLCNNAGQVQSMYQQVIDAYHPAGLDFDIEGGVNAPVLMQALAGLQRANSGVSLSLTLPVLPSGLVSAGTSLLAAARQAGFNPDVVNVMAMDYGSANDNGGNMLLSAQQAANSTRNQVSAAGLSSAIGVTVMIGVNDTSTEVFQLGQVGGLVSFAHSNGFIKRLAVWSLGRDNGSCAGAGFASATCSGQSQNTFDYAHAFGSF